MRVRKKAISSAAGTSTHSLRTPSRRASPSAVSSASAIRAIPEAGRRKSSFWVWICSAKDDGSIALAQTANSSTPPRTAPQNVPIHQRIGRGERRAAVGVRARGVWIDSMGALILAARCAGRNVRLSRENRGSRVEKSPA